MKKIFLFATSKELRYLSVSWLIALAFVGFLPALAQAQTISGTVFRDFNADGAYTAIPSSGTYTYGEPGVAGVIVTAYSSNSATAPFTTTTNAAGSYTLNVGSTNQFRIEFTNLITGDFDGFKGTANSTSVQFSNGGSNVNFGVNYPANYCQMTNPQLVTTCFVAINATNSPPLGSRDALVGVPYEVVDNTKTVSHYAVVNDIGAAWGLAYKKDTKQLFSAAFTKRHVGFAHGGPNAIYVTNLGAATPSTTQFFNFTTVGGTAVTSTTEAHGNDIPTDLNSSNRLDSYDIPAFDAVGKTSLGDIDISDDDKTLYVVNLKNRTLYLIDIATKTPTGFAIPNPCGGQSYRPFAVKYYRGKVYLGVVCTREDLNLDANNDRRPDTYTSTAGLSATVYEFDGSSFTSVLSFPLTYKKQATNADQSGQARAEYWRPWATTYQTDRSDTSYPEAWLTDIEFDVNGDMILGLRDRFGDQMGYQNRRPIAGDGALISAISPGEVLRAGKCNPLSTQWTLENDGSVCGSTASSNQTGSEGPGSGKYYWGDRVQNGANHGMSSQAGLALLAGSGKLAMTAIDPLDDFNTGGIKRMLNATGAKDGNATGTSYNPGAGAQLYGGNALDYGKANGLGDLEVLCNPAPIQIGNRVWRDTDNDGVQDAGEPALAGIRVQLTGPGVPANTTVLTGTNGEYYFSNASGTNATGFVYSLTGLTSGSSYSLTFPTSTSAGVLLLSSKANSATGSNADAIDTDANSAGVISFILGSAGENNFTYDAAYIPTPPCLVSLTATPGTCQSATNQYALTGTVNFTATPGGILTISDDGANTPVVSMTISVPAGSTSIAFSLTGLGSGGRYHLVTASFSTTACGTQSMTYLSPVSCTAAPCIGTNLLVNPSFEQGFPAQPNGQATQSPPPGWVSGTSDNNPQSFAAPDGYAYGFSTDNGSLCQSVSATVGSTYSLVFYAGVHVASGQTVTLSFLNSSSAVIGTPRSFTSTYILESTNSFGGPYSLSGIAPAGTTQVRVCAVSAAGTGSNFWSKIDNVCLTGTMAPCNLSVAVTTPVCNSATNTYTATGTISLSNTPAGSLTITDNGVTVGVISVTAGQASATFSVSGLSNASSHSLTVSSSNATCGIASQTYTAPVSCSVAPCGLSLTVTPGLCQTATNRYTLSMQVAATNVPGSGTLTTSSLAFSPAFTQTLPTGNSSGNFSFSGLVSNGQVFTVTSAFSTTACAPVSQTFMAPASCSVAPVCSLTATPTAGICQTATNTFSSTVLVQIANPGAGGVMVVTDGGLSQTVLVGAGLGSFVGTAVFVGLPSNEQSRIVTVSLPGCSSTTTTYAAPESCTVCSLTATPTAGICQTATNTYSSTVTIQITNTGAGGTLTATDGGVSQTVLVGAGVTNYTGELIFTNLPSDGQSHIVTASLPGCSSLTTTYMAPASCSVSTPCSALLSITPGVCSTLTNTYSATAILTANNIQAPRSVTVTVAGQAQVLSLTASGINTVTYELNGLVSDGEVKTATAIFSGTTCGDVSTTFAAPASCSVAPVCSLTATSTAGLCNTATNTYSSTVVVQITNTGAGGVLTITDGSRSQTLTVGAGLTSFTGTAVFNNLTSDEQGHIITASLPGCSSITGGYTAPASCSVALPCSATLAVTPGICSTLTNTYSATAMLQLANVVTPQTVTITVGGVSSTPVSLSAGNNIVTFVATGLTSDGLSKLATAIFSGTACASASTTYAAPASCTVCSLSLTTSLLPNGQVSTTYSETLTASGGTTPVVFAISAGDLPAGLSLNGATGVIAGTPTSATTASFTLTVTDAKNCSIVAPLTITTAADPVCSLTVTATPGECNTATNTYTLTGIVSATNGPGSQSLTISVGGTNTVVMLASTSGPVGYTLTDLPSNGSVATVTVLSSATACGMASVTYTAPASCSVAPLTPTFVLDKLVSTGKAKVGEVISYTIVLVNTGPVAATSVVVSDSYTGGLSLLPGSLTISDGSYTPGMQGGTWAIASLPVGATATLTYLARVTAEGVIYNTASIPGDEAQVCTTVPFAVCKDTPFAIALSVPAGFSRYQWYHTAPNSTSATVVADGTLNSFTATLAGEYKVVVDEGINGRCAQLACCPILIEEIEVPAYTAQGKNPTCVGTTPQVNGEITLVGLGVDPTVYFYQVSTGTSFTASTAVPAQPTPVPTDGLVATGLADGTYTVRVWVLVEGQPSCPRDVTVTLAADCTCPEEVCIPIIIRKVKKP